MMKSERNWKAKAAQKIVEMTGRMVEKTVGRSIPVTWHEPKMPDEVRELIKERDLK